jgi:hypothetical protein
MAVILREWVRTGGCRSVSGTLQSLRRGRAVLVAGVSWTMDPRLMLLLELEGFGALLLLLLLL